MRVTELAATADLLGRLVAFDTTSNRSNLPLVGFVQDYLAGFGVEAEIIPDKSGAKANLHAVIGGRPDVPGVVLSGHTDVVPTDGQNWTTDPYRMTERDGLLHGRGTTDMKGFLAACLAAVPTILDARLKTPLHLAFSYDEEIGCLGVPSLIETLLAREARPYLCIVGEPTCNVPILAHKGKRALRCLVHGVAAHSSLTHLGGNAVEAAAEIVTFIKALHHRLMTEGSRDDGYVPGHTTVQTSIIRGGTATNIVPSFCQFDFEIRHLPQDDAAAILLEIQEFAERNVLPHLKERGAQARIEWEAVFGYPPLDTDPESEAARLVCRIAEAAPGAKASYGTEGGLFQQAGIPTVICGPGSIEQAHKPDEFIAAGQLADCDRFLRKLVAGLH